MTDYAPPVDQLLTYGKLTGTYRFESWPDYVHEFGFTTDHVPELIRLMTDKTYWEGDPEQVNIWAPCHAWRVLAQLQAVEVVAPLLDMFEEYEDDDYLNEQSTEVIAAIGPAALPIVEPYLQREDFSQWGKNSIVLGINKIAEHYPEHQQACIDILCRQLENFQTNDASTNGWLVEGLVKLKVMDAAPLIERVYKEGDIDDMCAGTWPKVQVRLGLKQRSDFTKDEMLPAMARNLRSIDRMISQRQPSTFDLGGPPNRKALTPETPSKFGEGFLKAPKSTTQQSTQGFGQSTSPQKGSKKKKKKKK
jgi:hypothetical protein